MKQSELDCQQNQNYFNLDTFSNWIYQNVSQKQSSPLKSLLQRQALNLPVSLKSKQQLLQTLLSRVQKNNNILSHFINFETTPQRLSLMEEDYDNQQCQRALEEVLKTAPKDLNQESNSIIIKKRIITKQNSRLIRLINAEKDSNRMIQEMKIKMSRQYKYNNREKFDTEQLPQNYDHQNPIQTQLQTTISFDDLLNQYINNSQLHNIQHQNIDVISNNNLQQIGVQYLELDNQLQPNQIQPKFNSSQTYIKSQEIKPTIKPLYLQPLDAQLEIFGLKEAHVIQIMEANQVPANTSDRMQEL